MKWHDGIKASLTHFYNKTNIDKIKGNNVFASIYRSGYNWLRVTVNVALNIANGYYGYYSSNDGHIRWLFEDVDVFKEITYPHAGRTLCFHTHKPYNDELKKKAEECIPSIFDDFKLVIMQRNLIHVLESMLFWDRFTPETQDAYLKWKKRPPMDYVIEFSNSWGELLDIEEDKGLSIKYEDMIKNQKKEVSRFLDHLGVEIPKRCIIKAVDLCSRENMRKHIHTDENDRNIRVSAKHRGNVYSDENIEKIRRRLNNELRYDFGYEY